MFVAQELRKKNIGEYFIYMFQIEDLIRACEFDSGTIKAKVVERYKVDSTLIDPIFEWYCDMASMMKEEGVLTNGHLGFINHKLTEVFDFHLYLLENKKEYADYIKSYGAVQDYLAELSKICDEKSNVVKLIVEAIYLVVLLKMKGQTINAATLESISKLSRHMNLLAEYFRKYETGEIAIGDPE